MQDLEHVQHWLAVEKQSNAEMAEAIRRQRRAAAKQEAEAAGREHKHQDEVQELRKVSMQQPSAGSSPELARALTLPLPSACHSPVLATPQH